MLSVLLVYKHVQQHVNLAAPLTMQLSAGPESKTPLYAYLVADNGGSN